MHEHTYGEIVEQTPAPGLHTAAFPVVQLIEYPEHALFDSILQDESEKSASVFPNLASSFTIELVHPLRSRRPAAIIRVKASAGVLGRDIGHLNSEIKFL